MAVSPGTTPGTAELTRQCLVPILDCTYWHDSCAWACLSTAHRDEVQHWRRSLRLVSLAHRPIADQHLLVLARSSPFLQHLAVNSDQDWSFYNEHVERVHLSTCLISERVLKGLVVALWIMHGTRLLSLDFRGCLRLTNGAIHDIGACCPMLEYLNLSGCQQITDFTALAQCSALKTLLLEAAGAPASNAHRPFTGIQAIACHCHSLRTLSLKSRSSMTDDDVVAIARGCPLLEVLDLWLATAQPLSLTTLSELCRNCAGLRKLDLSRSTPPKTAAEAFSLLALLPRLENLIMNDVGDISVVSLQTLLAGCSRLLHLDVFNHGMATDPHMDLLAAHCSGLQHLNLGSSRITVRGLQALVTGCRQLRFLDLSYRETGEEDDPLPVLTTASLPELRRVRLAFTAISDATLLAFAAAYPQLESLDVHSCPIQGETVAKVAELCHGLQHLSAFDIIDDAVLTRVAKACPRMEYLSLNGSENVTDAGLASVAKHCRGLRAIDFWYGGISDAGISALVRSCVHLQYVGIDACEEPGCSVGDDTYHTHLLLDGRWTSTVEVGVGGGNQYVL